MTDQKEAKYPKDKVRHAAPSLSSGTEEPGEQANVVLVSNPPEESFAKDLTDKLSYATMPGARELASAVGDDTPILPDDPKILSQIVGDPHAEEKHWYSAFAQAGSRDLSGKPSATRVWLYRAAAAMGVFFSITSIMLCYVSSVFFASDAGFLWLNLHNNTFLNDLVGLDYMGYFVAGAAAITFWAAFFGFYKRTFRYIAIALFMGAAYHSLQFHLSLETLPAVLFAAAYLPSFYLLEWIGAAVREALPMHIGSKKLASVLMPSLAFPGIAMLSTFVIINSPGYSQNTNYGSGTPQEMAFNAFSIFLCTLIPGFVLARSTNSKSPSGSATLAVLLQAPLILGIVLSIATCALLGVLHHFGLQYRPSLYFINLMGGGDWAHLAATKSLALFDSLALVVASAGAGGAFGAWLNGKLKDKKDEKPVELG